MTRISESCIECDLCGERLDSSGTSYDIDLLADNEGWTRIVNIKTLEYKHYCPRYKLMREMR